MDSSQERDTSHIIVSDSEDEIPGSRDTSNTEDTSRLDRGWISMSRTSKPVRGVKSSKTIIDDTESEEEDEDENSDSLNRDDKGNKSIESGWMHLIEKDGDKVQKKNQEASNSDDSEIFDKKAKEGDKDQGEGQGESDSDESIVQLRSKGSKRSAWKSAIVDEESESGKEDLEASETSDSENDSDDDYSASVNSDDSEISDNLQVKIKKVRGKKFLIEDSSSDGESASPVKPTGQKYSTKSLKVVQTNQELEETEQHIALDDSCVEVPNSKDIRHSIVVDSEDSIDNQSSSDHLSPSMSNSSAPDIAISLAKEESFVNGIDPLLVQKRVLDTFKLEQLEKDLLRAKTLYNTANREQLPDRGEKLRQSIETLQKDVERLSIRLEQTSHHFKSGSPMVNIKTEPPRLSPQAQIRAEFDAAQFIKPEKELGKKAQATFEREQALTVERLNHLQQSLNRCPEEDDRAEDPRGLRTKLMAHQQHALAWLLWREKEKPPGGLLADDMGLGKTLTMISLVVATKDESYSDSSASDDDEDERWSNHKKYGRPKGGTLVVCPASLLDQWQNEVNNRCRRGVITVELHHGQRREIVPKRLAKNDMVITTYQIVASELKKNSTLFKIRWKRIILDEAHIIRNHAGKISEAVCKLSARNRWALTGTPIHNKEQDLYALLKFLRVTPFNDLQVWKRWVDNKNQTGLKRLATVTKTLMLRRTKQELIAKGTLEELPEKFTTDIDVILDSEETKVYQSVLAFSQTLFAQFLAQRAEKEHMKDLNAGKFDKPAYMAQVEASHFAAAQKQLLGRKGEDVKAHHILVLILRLRQICCHPGLIKEMLNAEEAEANGIVPEEEEDIQKDLVAQVNNLTLLEDDKNKDQNEDNLFSLKNPVFLFDRPSSKIKAILGTVENILEKGEKMIIVSQWTGMLGIISAHLSAIKGATHEMFSGSVPIKKRQGIVDRFNDRGDDLMILLLSLTAGGVGLNLVGGNHLLLIDIHWNPQLESQAQDRIYRFGQKKNVHVYKFICNETIEQRVRQLQKKKLNLAEDVFTGHRRTSNKLSLDDLKSIFEI